MQATHFVDYLQELLKQIVKARRQKQINAPDISTIFNSSLSMSVDKLQIYKQSIEIIMWSQLIIHQFKLLIRDLQHYSNNTKHIFYSTALCKQLTTYYSYLQSLDQTIESHLHYLKCEYELPQTQSILPNTTQQQQLSNTKIPSNRDAVLFVYIPMMTQVEYRIEELDEWLQYFVQAKCESICKHSSLYSSKIVSQTAQILSNTLHHQQQSLCMLQLFSQFANL